MFKFSNTPVPVRNDLTLAFSGVWTRLARPGTWWTGTERVAIAQVARDSYGGAELTAHPDLSEAATLAASLLSRKPAAVTADLIQGWESVGLDSNRYVELVAVVSQITAIDTFHRALGVDLEPLPIPQPGDPTEQLPDIPAKLTRAWVPMVGPPTIPTSLSAVPAEMVALEQLHGPMYLRYEEMSDPAVQKGLSRAQQELVAARTSAINECFF
jgi:alkylhydroperoxidase family enzyme